MQKFDPEITLTLSRPELFLRPFYVLNNLQLFINKTVFVPVLDIHLFSKTFFVIFYHNI